MTFEHFAIGVGLVLLLFMIPAILRIVRGPTALDRIVAVNVIGTKTIVLLALVGFLYGRPGFFLDIALAYALINFIATIAVLRYMERRAALRSRGAANLAEEDDQ